MLKTIEKYCKLRKLNYHIWNLSLYIFKIRMIKVASNSEQRWSIHQENYSRQTTTSQYHHLYQDLIKPAKIDLQKKIQSFNQNRIQYDQGFPYKKFHFSIERIVPYFGFYRFHVQIGLFRLKIHVAKFQCFNIFKKKRKNKGNFSSIYFANLRGKSLFFKNYRYSSQKEFQRIFSKIIKQWAILKICSVLGTAPHIQNYLGFDIIIYYDSIQFAVQKGRQITSLTDSQTKILKQQLSLMHQFNIIHSDIKPDNIIFSQYFNKPVFIDFGFSEIINESIGNKTFTSFKGTPNFCTYQMLELILDRKGLIDLYYNDAFALKQTYTYLKSVVNFIQAESTTIVEQQHLCQENYQSEFIFYEIQFYYVSNNDLMIQQLTKYFLTLNQNNIKKLLLFMKQVADYVFLQKFFYQYLKQYKKMAEYQQIQDKIRYGSQVLYFNKNIDDSDSSKNDNVFCCSLQLSDSIQHNYQNYIEIIMNTTKIEAQSIQYIVPMVFNCIRFDQKNIDVKDKLKLACKINPLLSAYLMQENSNLITIKSMRNEQHGDLIILIRIIVKYCLWEKPNKWIISNLFDVFQQSIILNDYVELIDPFFLYLLSKRQFYDPLITVYQLQRLLESTSMIKPFNIPHLAVIKEKFQRIIQEFSSICSIKYEDIVYKQIQDNNFLDKELQDLLDGRQSNTLQNFQLKKYFFYVCIYKKIKYFYQIGKTKQITKIIQIVKRSVEIQSIDFLSRMRLSINLMYSTYNCSSLQKYYKYIAQTINCPSVYNNFKNQLFIQTYDDNISFKINQLIERIPYLGLEMYFQIMQIIQFINQQDQSIINSLQTELLNLYKVYEQVQHLSLLNVKQSIQMFLHVYHRLNIEFYYYQFTVQTGKAFLHTLQLYQQQFKIISANSQQHHLITLSTFKVYTYKYYLSIQNNQFKDSYFFLQKLINLCLSANLAFFIQKFIKMFYKVGARQSNMQVVVFSVNKYFSFIKTNNQFVLYLLPVNSDLFVNTLNIYARINPDTFHQICIQITQYLSYNPFHSTKSYFINLLAAIDYFLKYVSQFGYLMHFSHFDNRANFKTNPYLLIFYIYSLYHSDYDSQLKLLKKFAANCVYLSHFARKKLLQKYFSVIMAYGKQKDRKNRIYLFRYAKNYLDAKTRNKQIKNLLSSLSKSIFHIKLRNKMHSQRIKQ